MTNNQLTAFRADGGDISQGRIKEIADNAYGDEEKRRLAQRLLAAEAELQEHRKADEVITATIPNPDPFGVGGKEIKVIYGVRNRCPQCNGTRNITCTCEGNKS